MCKSLKPLVAAATLLAGLLAAPTLYADDSVRSQGHGSMMDSGMMNMTKIGQMSQMMDRCNQMVQVMTDGSDKPNQQWRKEAPTTPEKNG